jgi:uncharacterized protein with PIN domain
MEQMRMAGEQQMEQFKAHLATQQQQSESRATAQLEQMRMMQEQQAEQNRQNMELLIARMNNAAKIEVAEIAAQTTLNAVQITAAKQGAE